LARLTSDGAWLDYVVELHLATRSVMSLQVVAAFQLARRWVGESDQLLLRYYVEALLGRPQNLTEDERGRVRLLQKLLS
jgi:hypothetical protein